MHISKKNSYIFSVGVILFFTSIFDSFCQDVGNKIQVMIGNYELSAYGEIDYTITKLFAEEKLKPEEVFDICKESESNIYFKLRLSAGPNSKHSNWDDKSSDTSCDDINEEGQTLVVQMEPAQVNKFSARFSGGSSEPVDFFPADPIIRDQLIDFVKSKNSDFVSAFSFFEADVTTMAEHIFDDENRARRVWVYYDKDFFDNEQTDKRVLEFIMLHELGHVQVGPYYPDFRIIQEEVADKYAGEEFRKLYPDMTFEEFDQLLTKQVFAGYVQSEGYPSLENRLAIIKQGWDNGDSILKNANKEKIEEKRKEFDSFLLKANLHDVDDREQLEQIRSHFRSKGLNDIYLDLQQRLGFALFQEGLFYESKNVLTGYEKGRSKDYETISHYYISDFHHQNRSVDKHEKRTITPTQEEWFLRVIDSSDVSDEIKAEIAYNLAKIYIETWDYEKAIAALNKAQTLSKYAPILYEKAKLLSSQYFDNFDENMFDIVALYEEAIEQERNSGYSHDSRINTYNDSIENLKPRIYNTIKANPSLGDFKKLWDLDSAFCKAQKDYFYLRTKTAYQVDSLSATITFGKKVLGDTLQYTKSSEKSVEIKTMVSISNFIYNRTTKESDVAKQDFETMLYDLWEYLNKEDRPELILPDGFIPAFNEEISDFSTLSNKVLSYAAVINYKLQCGEGDLICEDSNGCKFFEFIEELKNKENLARESGFINNVVYTFLIKTFKGNRDYEDIGKMSDKKRKRVLCK